MPSAPLYYTPLVHAAIASTPVGKTTIGGAVDAQLNFSLSAGADGNIQISPASNAAAQFVKGPGAEGLQATVVGLATLMNGRPGAKLTDVRLATDALGYVANRTYTFFGNHPDKLDTASPEEASALALKVAGSIEQEAAKTGTRIAQGTLDVSPEVTAVLGKRWGGQAVTATEAVGASLQIAREVERATSPIAPDSHAGRLHWVEDATIDVLSTWNGRLAATAKTMNLASDDPAFTKAFDASVAQVRKDAMSVGRNQALGGLLQLAGVNVNDAGHAGKATTLLQSGALEQTPALLAADIVSHNKLAPDKVDWVANRILEVEGHAGNVAGLAAEIAAMKGKP